MCIRDRDGIEQFGVKLRTELEQVLTRIHMETGSASFNPNSPKQLGEMLFDTMGPVSYTHLDVYKRQFHSLLAKLRAASTFFSI